MSSAAIGPQKDKELANGAAPVLQSEGRTRDASNPSGEIGRDLTDEIRNFHDDCNKRYAFNSHWDNILNIAGLLLSVGIVASGIYQKGGLSAILGAFVAAIVSAQKAFPFGQRANFYRILMEQGANLETDVQQGLVSKQDAVRILKSLRLDFAQQLPRGSTFNSTDVPDASIGPKQVIPASHVPIT